MSTTRAQRGSLAIVVLPVLIALILTAILIVVVKSHRKTTPPAAVSRQSSQPQEDATQKATDAYAKSPAYQALTARNTKRSNDVSVAAAAVAGFMNTNSEALPTAYANGQLIGGAGMTPVALQVTQFRTVVVAQGEQPEVKADELHIVTGATCSNHGSTMAGTDHQYAILYGLEYIDNATFTSNCLPG